MSACTVGKEVHVRFTRRGRRTSIIVALSKQLKVRLSNIDPSLFKMASLTEVLDFEFPREVRHDVSFEEYCCFITMQAHEIHVSCGTQEERLWLLHKTKWPRNHANMCKQFGVVDVVCSMSSVDTKAEYERMFEQPCPWFEPHERECIDAEPCPEVVYVFVNSDMVCAPKGTLLKDLVAESGGIYLRPIPSKGCCVPATRPLEWFFYNGFTRLFWFPCEPRVIPDSVLLADMDRKLFHETPGEPVDLTLRGIKFWDLQGNYVTVMSLPWETPAAPVLQYCSHHRVSPARFRFIEEGRELGSQPIKSSKVHVIKRIYPRRGS